MTAFRCITLLLGALLLAACAANQPIRTVESIPHQGVSKNPPLSPANQAAGLSVVNAARSLLGTPYRFGGSSPKGFDCSGLVTYVYRQAGIQIPRTSSDQYQDSQKVALTQLQPGDLLFFRLSPPKISHVAIYAGDGRFIHAPSSGKYVSYASLEDPYWRKHLIAAGRF